MTCKFVNLLVVTIFLLTTNGSELQTKQIPMSVYQYNKESCMDMVPRLITVYIDINEAQKLGVDISQYLTTEASAEPENSGNVTEAMEEEATTPTTMEPATTMKSEPELVMGEGAPPVQIMLDKNEYRRRRMIKGTLYHFSSIWHEKC